MPPRNEGMSTERKEPRPLSAKTGRIGRSPHAHRLPDQERFGERLTAVPASRVPAIEHGAAGRSAVNVRRGMDRMSLRTLVVASLAVEQRSGESNIAAFFIAMAAAPW